MSVSIPHEAETRFLADVGEHAITVLLDQGLYRHLRFAKPGTGHLAFSIVTWPGRLCFCGDMGDYVFTRLEDMLVFFRHEQPNYGYWAEKCVAQDRSGIRQYSPDQFIERVREMAKEATESLDEKMRAEVLEALEADVISRAGDEHDARSALDGFCEQGVQFIDTWELSFEEYTYRYVWCCNALVWAVKQYDAYRANAMAEVAP